MEKTIPQWAIDYITDWKQRLLEGYFGAQGKGLLHQMMFDDEYHEQIKGESDMSEIGLGVLVHMLSNNKETLAAIEASEGKIIQELKIDPEANGEDGELVFVFADTTKLRVFDGGRSCCESRYLTCDDDLDGFIGATLDGFDVREGPEVQSDEVHETGFLIVATSKGEFTVITHNEHNGYYGGFALVARMESG